MQNEQFKTILQYIDITITQAVATADADYISDAVDQIHDLIKLHVDLIEEDE